MFMISRIFRLTSLTSKVSKRTYGHSVLYNQFRRKSTQTMDVSEIKISIPYGNLAAKAWGSPSGIPVLALHGWMDNCGTFDRLIPQLPQTHYYVALDLPGHGFSSHRPPGCFYTYLDMIIDLKRVVDHFDWKEFSFLSHSMGGEIALLWASIYPKTVRKIILLDVIKPFSNEFSKLVESAQQSVDGSLNIEKKLTQSPPVYTPETALKRLVEGMENEITEESAAILLKRGSQPAEDGEGLKFTRDLRIRFIEPFNVMSHQAAKTFASNITCDILSLHAQNPGTRFKSPCPEEDKHFIEIYKKNCKIFIMEMIDGNHFMHLNDPLKISPIITKFLNS